ncbi:MAG TPA: vanadium-dependent haloperoxidase [Acidimicrobiales bacterium]|nr:vanadium-dependent haloperoxidase [Acidimicrobiales bacterium]
MNNALVQDLSLRRRALVVTVGVLLASALGACGDDKDDKPAAPQARSEPTAGQWKTWVLTSASEIPVAPPPAKGTAIYDADQARVVTAARLRMPEDTATVRKWSGPLPTRPWTEAAFDFVSKSAKNPPLSSRNYALVHAAMYDATVASWHYKYVYGVPAPSGVETMIPTGPDPSYPSEHAAIAGAASRVLAYLYPEQSALRLEEMAEEAANSRITAGTNTPADTEAGLALGRAIADRTIARAKADGADTAWDGQRPPGIGGGPDYWEPPPGTVSPPTAPVAGSWKTWVLPSAAQLRPPPPPAYGSPEFRAAAQELVDIRNNLTPEQEKIARYWEGTEGTKLPAGIVIDTYSPDIEQAATTGPVEARLTVPRTARAFALLTIALADGGIAVWDAKYTYWTPRPENAIRDLGLVPDWKPYLPTPRFPAYPSGSAGYAGAAETVMNYVLPGNAAKFRDRADEQAMSRLYAGIHWRFDSISLDGGRHLGNLVVDWAKADGSGP